MWRPVWPSVPMAVPWTLSVVSREIRDGIQTEDDQIFSDACDLCFSRSLMVTQVPCDHINFFWKTVTAEEWFRGLTGMDNIHGAHCATSVVEDPLLVQINVSTGQLLVQLGHDESNYGTRVITVSTNGT